MKSRRRNQLAKRRQRATSYTVLWMRALAARLQFEQAIPKIAARSVEYFNRRRENRRRKGKPDRLAIDRVQESFLAYLLRTGKSAGPESVR